jgi:pimeloyl-ACP methyl ester carboxylesterase
MSEPQPAAPILDRDATVNGITLHYATWGSYTSPERTIMMVHGVTASSRSFGPCPPVLAAEGWYVIAPDLRGRGLSAKPAHGYNLMQHVEDVLALSDALGLGRLNLVGYSMGARIALILAALNPDRANRLVLVDAGGEPPADAFQTVNATLRRIGQVYPSLDAFLEERRQAPIYTWNPFWEAYFRYDVEVAADGTVRSRMPRHALEQEIVANDLMRDSAAVPLVRAPTLIMRAELGTTGPATGYVLPPEDAERLHATIPGSELLIVPGTNHYTILLSAVSTDALVRFFGAG